MMHLNFPVFGLVLGGKSIEKGVIRSKTGGGLLKGAHDMRTVDSMSLDHFPHN